MRQDLIEPVLSVSAVSHDEAQERHRRGTRQLLLARGFLFASAYLMSAILARKLGAAEYGIYGVVISLLLWLEMLSNAGVPGATVKLIADGHHRGEVERSSRTLVVCFSLLLFGICWFLAPQAASLLRIPNGEVLLRIAVIDLPFAAIYASYDGILYGGRRFAVVAAAQMVHSMIKLIGVIALIGLGFSVQRVLFVCVLSTLVVCVALAVRYRPSGFRPSLAIMGRIAAISAPLALYLIGGQVLVNLDLWSLKSLWEGKGEVVGQYVASLNLAKTLTVIPAVQAGVLFTSVAWAISSRDVARARRHIQEATRFALIVSAAAWVILGLNASETLSVLFSKAYAEGHAFLPLQLAGFGLFALLDVFAHSLMAAGRQWLTTVSIVATVPFVALSNYFLIPRFGPLGAASSMLIGMIMATSLIGAMTYRHFGALVQCSTLVRVLVAAAVAGISSVAVPVSGPLILVKVVLLGGVYLLVLHISGEITGKDFGLTVETASSSSA